MPILLALALAAQQAPADDADFHTRAALARQAEHAATGPAYQKAMWEKIGNPTTDAYRSCLQSNQMDATPFSLVADVAADGHLEHLAVLPATAVARCMAGQYASWQLPAPPAQAPYPIVIDFSIKK